MQLTERAEEILEALWIDVVERGKTPDASLLKDSGDMKELIDKKYLSPDEKELFTPKGKEEGRLCVRRHRLAERLLVDILHVKDGLVHEAGCKLEHILHKGLEDNICTLLGHPKQCPHGKIIPEGKCCKKMSDKTESIVRTLSSLKKGQKGKVAYIRTDNKEVLRKIMAMGILPGLSISLIQRFPSYVFQLGESQFAVDREIADHVQVWLSN